MRDSLASKAGKLSAPTDEEIAKYPVDQLTQAKEFKSSRIANALKEMPPIRMISAKKNKIRQHRPITPLAADMASNSDGWYGTSSRLDS